MISWPGRNRRKSYSAPSASAISARAGAAIPAFARTASSVSPAAISRDQVIKGCSISGKAVSVKAGCTRGVGRIERATSICIAVGSDTTLSASRGAESGSGVQSVAFAIARGTGSLDSIPEIAMAVTEHVPAMATVAKTILIFMLPPLRLLSVHAGSSAPRILLARDSRSW